MRVLIHYESVEHGPGAYVMQVRDMRDEELMRKLRDFDKDYAVVLGIDCVPSRVMFNANHEARCVQ